MRKGEAAVRGGSARVTHTAACQNRVPARSSEQSRRVDRGVFGSVGKRPGRRRESRREGERERERNAVIALGKIAIYRDDRNDDDVRR